MNNRELIDLIVYIKNEKAQAEERYDKAKRMELEAEGIDAKHVAIGEEAFNCGQTVAYYRILKKLEEMVSDEIRV